MSFRFAEQPQRVDGTTSSAALSYAEAYTKIVHQLRQRLIEQADDTRNQRSLVRSIFNRMDDNASGVLTVQEMKDFLQSPELRIFQPDDSFCDKFCELILEQIDVNRDGNVSLDELEDFLFPTSPHGSPSKASKEQTDGHFETGIVLDFARRALIQLLSGAAAAGSDEAILAEFTGLAKVSVKKGKQIESRIAKKAFSNLFIPQFKRNLHEDEVDALMKTIDINGDGFITAKEFKGWLFPSSQNEEKVQLSLLLKSVIDENFGGDEKALFDEFKSYGADCIYKNDFVTNLKALDNTISRQLAQDLSQALAGNDKGITYGRFQDFLGLARSVKFEDSIPRANSQDDQASSLSPRLELQPQSPEQQSRAEMTAEQLSQHLQNIELRSDEENDDGEETVAVIEDPATLNFNEQAGSTVQTLDSLDIGNEHLAHGRVPFQGDINLEHTGGSHSSQEGDHRTLSRHGSGISMRSMSTTSPEKLHRSPSRRSDDSSGAGTGDGENRHMMKQRSLPNTMMRSILKQEQDRLQDTIVSEEGTPLARTKSAIPAMEVKPSTSGVTAQELHYVRELLQQGRHMNTGSTSPFKKAPAMKEVSLDYGVNKPHLGHKLQANQLLQQQQEDFETSQFSLSASMMSEGFGPSSSSKKVMKHGAVGLTSDQLIEFGYYKHSGKWRGFPLDTWSCCNTSAYICPNAKTYTAPKESTGISSITTPSFISTTRLSPKKLRSSTEITTRFSQEFEMDTSASPCPPPPPPVPQVAPPQHRVMKIQVKSPPKPLIDHSKMRVTVKSKPEPQPVPTAVAPGIAANNDNGSINPSIASLHVESKAMHLAPKPTNRNQHMLAMNRGRAQSQNVVSKQAASHIIVQRASAAINAGKAFEQLSGKKVSKVTRTPAPPLSNVKDTDALSKAYLEQVKDILHVSDPSQLQAEAERKYDHYEKVLLDLRHELDSSRQATLETRSLMNHVMKEQQESMSRLRAAVSHRMQTFQKVIKQYPSAHSRRNKNASSDAKLKKRSSSAPPRVVQSSALVDQSHESKEEGGDYNSEEMKMPPIDTAAEGLEEMFATENRNHRRSAAKKKQIRTARSVSPNHRIRSSLQSRTSSASPSAVRRKSFVGTRYDESYHPPTRNIKHKHTEGIPWVPPSTHANHKFNRAYAMDPNFRHHMHGTHPESESAFQIPVADIPKQTRVSRPSNTPKQRITPSKHKVQSDDYYLGSTNEDDDYFATLEDADLTSASILNNQQDKPKNFQSPPSYKFDSLDVDKLTKMMQASPSEDAWDSEYQRYVASNRSSTFNAVKRSGKSHQSPDHYLKIDQRAEPLPTHEEEEYNDDFEDHSYRSPTSNKRHHVREEIEEVSVSHVLPSSPLIEAIRSFQTNVEEKSDWWSRIMAEKQNRENQAFRQSLIQQQPK